MKERLLSIMRKKKTKLALAADVRTKKELLALADLCGPEICLFKTHIDIIEDFDLDLTIQLKALAKKHEFLIVEDRKFADIGAIAQAQLTGGIYKIADWADLVIAHGLAGPESVKAIASVCKERGIGLLLLAQFSAQGNLITPQYTEQVVQMAKDNADCVVGLIAQEGCSDKRFLILTPGVNQTATKDEAGQAYRPIEALTQTDIFIVGRGITQAKDPLAAAKALNGR